MRWAKVFTELLESEEEVILPTMTAPMGFSFLGASTVGFGWFWGEEVFALIDERINSCARFAESRCPHQAVAERVYLIPQALDAFTIGSCEKLCLRCGQFVRRDVPSATTPNERGCPRPAKVSSLSNRE